MAKGWKTYWRSPGEAGLPPNINLISSDNLQTLGAIHYPRPEQTTLLTVPSFGYSDHVIFSVPITRINPLKPTMIHVDFSLLLCANICIPATYRFQVTIPPLSSSYDVTHDIHQQFIRHQSSIPYMIEDFTPFGRLYYHGQTIDITLDDTIQFPAKLIMEFDKNQAYGVTISSNKQSFSIPFPMEQLQSFTLFSQNLNIMSYSLPIETSPITLLTKSLYDIGIILLFAFIGGFLLNFMPCVLPTLGLKFFKLSSLRTQESSPKIYRLSIIRTIMGILSLFILLAIILSILKFMGYAVGWGIQFQHPLFLLAIIGLMVYFSCWFMIPTWQLSPPFFIRYLSSFPVFNKIFHEDFMIWVYHSTFSNPL